MSNEQLEEFVQRLSNCDRDLRTAKGSVELLRELMLREGGVRGLDSELSTNVRVLDALRKGIQTELKRAKEKLASQNQLGLPLDGSA